MSQCEADLKEKDRDNTEFGLNQGSGLMVCVLALNSDILSLNPTEVYSISAKCCMKRTKINTKSPGLAH